MKAVHLRVAVFLFMHGVIAFAVEPWEARFFESEPAELLSAAAAVKVDDKADADAVILLAETSIQFDASGAKTTRLRTVYRILTEAGVEEWSAIEQGWAPWYEQRPEVRARVITADGVAHVLDQDTIDDSPSYDSPDLYSDARLLQAPLPAIEVGAVVEHEVIIRESRPSFEAGTTGQCDFGSYVPVQKTRLIITHPKSLPLRHSVQLLPGLEPVRTTQDASVTLLFEAGPMGPVEYADLLLPPDVPAYPQILYSTGASWKDIAGRYAEIVEERIAGGEYGSILSEVLSGTENRATKIEKLLALVQKEVRYTGIEFGEAAIVPRKPAETLKRKYGDCKDKATLLAALLRAAGIPAQLALLRASTGQDIDPTLPGISSFNHVIVHVPGSPAIWIDPTDEFSRASELPAVDQGRHALIAARETKGPIKTPEAPSSRNTSVQDREFYLSEDGGARVVETTVYSGVLESEERSSYSGVDEKEIRKWMDSYAESEYISEKVTSVERTASSDLTKPFRLRIEMTEAGRGTTSEGEAVVGIFPSQLLEFLPHALREEMDEEEDDEGVEDEEEEKERTSDLMLPRPFTREIRYTITPPPGHRVKSLPDSFRHVFGGLVVSGEFKPESDGVVRALLRIDTGNRRITPAELNTINEGAQTIADLDPLLVTYEPLWAVYVDSGKIREALTELDRLIALHPGEALHRAQKSEVLLDSGLGEAARAEIQRAIEVEPGSSLAHWKAGWIWAHDQLGRRFGKGFDREKAIASYRQALELRKDDTAVRSSLAILLEYDSAGLRYGPKSDMDGAIAEYRKIDKEVAGTGLQNNLPVALMWGRKFEELTKLARQRAPSAARNQWILIGVAASKGVDAALKEARAMDKEERPVALEGAAGILIRLRLYKEGVALLAEAAKGSAQTATIEGQLEKLRKTSRHEELQLSDRIPEDVVRKYLILGLSGDAERNAELLNLFARSTREYAQRETHCSLLETLKGTAAQQAALMPRDVLIDVGMAAINMRTDGDPPIGCRVRIEAGTERSVMFLIQEEGVYRVLGTDEELAPIGYHALRLADSGNIAAATKWLDWVREERAPRTAGAPADVYDSPFMRLWTGGAEGNRGPVRAAAAALMIKSHLAERALPIIMEARAGASSDEEAEVLEAAAVLGLVRLEKWEEALALTGKLRASHEDSDDALMMHAAALRGADRWEELKAIADSSLRRDPVGRIGRLLMYEVAEELSDYTRAEQTLRELIDSGKALPEDYNNYGWLTLFRQPVDPGSVSATISELRSALGQNPNRAALHTLAALYAEAGNLRPSLETLMQSIGSGDPEPHDWYVIGRLAEQYGLKSAAIDAYRKVTKPAKGKETTLSTHHLAERRMDAIGRTIGASAGQ